MCCRLPVAVALPALPLLPACCVWCVVYVFRAVCTLRRMSRAVYVEYDARAQMALFRCSSFELPPFA